MHFAKCALHSIAICCDSATTVMLMIKHLVERQGQRLLSKECELGGMVVEIAAVFTFPLPGDILCTENALVAVLWPPAVRMRNIRGMFRISF